MDETYVGGHRQDARWKGCKASGKLVTGRPGPNEADQKVPVFGMVQRGGKVAAIATNTVKSAELLPHVQMRVLPGSLIYSDEYCIYDALGTMGFTHHHIRHSQRVDVSGDVHTNTIEGVWSLVKRGLDGVFHSVSRKHLQGYLNEYAWRYNWRLSRRIAPGYFCFGLSSDFLGVVTFFMLLRKSLRFGTGIS